MKEAFKDYYISRTYVGLWWKAFEMEIYITEKILIAFDP